MPPEFARSADWLLEAISLPAGLELTLEYSPFDGALRASSELGADGKRLRYRITFHHAAAWAFVDLSLMLQYYPEHDCPPVVQEVDRDGDHVFIREFSIYKEAHGDNWRRFRLTIGDDVIEVVSADRPEVTRIA